MYYMWTINCGEFLIHSHSLSLSVHLGYEACSPFKWVMLWYWRDHIIRFVATYDDILHQVWSLCSMPIIPFVMPYIWDCYGSIWISIDDNPFLIDFAVNKNEFCICTRSFLPSISVNVVIRLCRCIDNWVKSDCGELIKKDFALSEK